MDSIKYFVLLTLKLFISVIKSKEIDYNVEVAELEMEFYHTLNGNRLAPWPELLNMNFATALRLCEFVSRNTDQDLTLGLVDSFESKVRHDQLNIIFRLSVKKRAPIRVNVLRCEINDNFVSKSEMQKGDEIYYNKMEIGTQVFYITRSAQPNCIYLLGNEGSEVWIKSQICGNSWKVRSLNSFFLQQEYLEYFKNFQSPTEFMATTKLINISPEYAFELCLNAYESVNNVNLRSGPINFSLNSVFSLTMTNGVLDFPDLMDSNIIPDVDLLRCPFDKINFSNHKFSDTPLKEFYIFESTIDGCVYILESDGSTNDLRAWIRAEVCAVLPLSLGGVENSIIHDDVMDI